ncbi:MAG: urease accessory protein UreD [Rhodocyclaceae bacterium]
MNARIPPSIALPRHSTPQDEATSHAGWRAELALRFERRGDCTKMVHCRHLGPLRIQKPLYPEGQGVCHAIVLHPPAGIVGGDSLALAVEVGEQAHALVTTPGAGKWYRSDGREAQFAQRIAVAAGGVCEWLPQESIVFDGARGRMRTEIELAADARFVGLEMTCFGRTGAGERFAHGQLAMSTRVTVAGRPVWLERGLVAGGGAVLSSAVGLGGYPVAGTLLVHGPGVDDGLRDACREILPDAGEGAVTRLPDLLVARYLGPACEPGRAWFARLWACIRPAVCGRPICEPRIWRT